MINCDNTCLLSPYVFLHLPKPSHHFLFFREPVNAKALGIWPAYPNIIKHPMDLGTIRKKCDRVLYNTRAEAIADLNQVWINAQTFNKPGHFVYEQSLVLEGVSKAKIKKLEADEASGVYDAKPVIAASHHHHHGIHTTPSGKNYLRIFYFLFTKIGISMNLKYIYRILLHLQSASGLPRLQWFPDLCPPLRASPRDTTCPPPPSPRTDRRIFRRSCRPWKPSSTE